MRRLTASVLAGAALLTMSCVPMAAGPPPASGSAPAYHYSPPPSDPPPVAASGSIPGDDPHWIRSDEYFVQGGALVQGWAWAYLAKMKQPPSPGTKGKALFV